MLRTTARAAAGGPTHLKSQLELKVGLVSAQACAVLRSPRQRRPALSTPQRRAHLCRLLIHAALELRGDVGGSRERARGLGQPGAEEIVGQEPRGALGVLLCFQGRGRLGGRECIGAQSVCRGRCRSRAMYPTFFQLHVGTLRRKRPAGQSVRMWKGCTAVRAGHLVRGGPNRAILCERGEEDKPRTAALDVLVLLRLALAELRGGACRHAGHGVKLLNVS